MVVATRFIDEIRRALSRSIRDARSASAAGPRTGLLTKRPSRRLRRGASAVETTLLVAGATAMGFSAYEHFGEDVKTKLRCLGAMVEKTDIGCTDPSEQALRASISSLVGAQPPTSAPGSGDAQPATPAPAVPTAPAPGGGGTYPTTGTLTKVTFRVTDDVDHHLVQDDEPGRNMEAAGNSTLTWVYGDENVVGVCGSLAAAMGISQEELFSGGTCVQVFGKTFRVQDQLQNDQGCDPSKPESQALDFHHDVESQMQSQFKDPSSDKSIKRADCGPSDHRTVFCPDGSNSAKLRFNGASKPVKSAKIVGGSAGQVLPGEGGFFRFNGLTAGKQTFEVTYADGTTERFTLDVPAPTSLAGTQIPGSNKDGEGMERAGEICTFDIAPGESATDRFAAASDRKECIKYLADNDDATRADAEAKGKCAP